MTDLSAETAYAFRHALVRDAAQQLMMPSTRSRLHALAFELKIAINSKVALRSNSEQMAEHALVASSGMTRGTVQHSKWLRRYLTWMRRSVRMATLRHDHGHASSLMLRILSNARLSVFREWEVRQNLARCNMQLGRMKDAMSAIERAEALSVQLTSNERVATLLSFGQIEQFGGNVDAALARFRAALKEAVDPAETYRCMVMLSKFVSERGDLDEGSRLAERALGFAKESRLEVSTLDLELDECLRMQMRGDGQQAAPILSRLLTKARDTDDKLAEIKALTRYAETRPQSERIEIFMDALNIAKQIGSIHRSNMLMTNLSLSLRHANRIQEAQQFAFQARDLAIEAEHPRSYALSLGACARCALVRGYPNRARRIYEKGQAVFGTIHDRKEQAMFLYELFYVSLLVGDVQVASRWSDKFSEVAENSQNARVRDRIGFIADARVSSAKHEAWLLGREPQKPELSKNNFLGVELPEFEDQAAVDRFWRVFKRSRPDLFAAIKTKQPELLTLHPRPETS